MNVDLFGCVLLNYLLIHNLNLKKQRLFVPFPIPFSLSIASVGCCEIYGIGMSLPCTLVACRQVSLLLKRLDKKLEIFEPSGLLRVIMMSGGSLVHHGHCFAIFCNCILHLQLCNVYVYVITVSHYCVGHTTQNRLHARCTAS